jgi:predicted protein tyrosine phosphatase
LGDVAPPSLAVDSVERNLFAGRAGLDVASAGLNNGANVTVSVELIEWADIIFVMDKSHRNRLSKKFKPHLKNKRLICLDIPDEYDYMVQELVTLLEKCISIS